MKIVELLLKEIAQEAEITRKMLALLPADKMDWQPHPKSMSLMRLANHIAELPGWIAMGLTTDGLDFAISKYEPTIARTAEDILALFEQRYAKAKTELEKADEDLLTESWILRNRDYVILNQTKYDTVRVAIAQTIHHRAQLGVFLRLLDIAIPGSYGPSADEM